MFHGNYCGPYWSAGKLQRSVVSDVLPTDEFDSTCKEHDSTYARNGDLKTADEDFYSANIGKGPLRSGAAIAVGIQGLLRARKNSTKNTTQNMPNLRTNAKKKTAYSNTTSKGNDRVTGAPVAISTRRTTSKPKITHSATGVTVTHRTFLSPVSNEAAFTIEKYPTNPALASTFPWLSKIAARYDKYRYKKLKFEYRSVAATSTAGVIMMSFDFDASDTTPGSKLVQAQTVPNAENNSWMNNDLTIKTDNLWRFTRQGTVTGTDIKTYDYGNLFISSLYGNGVVSGELYVDYIVELDKPSHPAPLAMTITAGSVLGAPFTSSVVLTGLAQPWSVVPSLPTTTLQADTPGEYLLIQRVLGTGITAMANPTTDGVVTLKLQVIGATNSMSVWKVRLDKSDYIAFNNVTATTQTNIDVYVNEWDYSTL